MADTVGKKRPLLLGLGGGGRHREDMCQFGFPDRRGLWSSSRLSSFETLLLEHRGSSREEVGKAFGRARHGARLPATVEMHHLVTPTAHDGPNQYSSSVACIGGCRDRMLAAKSVGLNAAEGGLFPGLAGREHRERDWIWRSVFWGGRGGKKLELTGRYEMINKG